MIIYYKSISEYADKINEKLTPEDNAIPMEDILDHVEDFRDEFPLEADDGQQEGGHAFTIALGAKLEKLGKKIVYLVYGDPKDKNSTIISALQVSNVGDTNYSYICLNSEERTQRLSDIENAMDLHYSGEGKPGWRQVSKENLTKAQYNKKLLKQTIKAFQRLTFR